MIHSVVAGREKKRSESHKAQCKCLKMRDPQKPSKSIWLGSQLFLKFVYLHLFRVLNLCICHNTCSLWCFSLVLLQHPRNRHSLIGFHLKLVRRFTPPLLSINGRLPLSGGLASPPPAHAVVRKRVSIEDGDLFQDFSGLQTQILRSRNAPISRHICGAPQTFEPEKAARWSFEGMEMVGWGGSFYRRSVCLVDIVDSGK